MSNTVYPTFSEILRFFLVSMDIKNYSINGQVFAKEIDNLVAKNTYDPREFEEVFKKTFDAILKELLGVDNGQLFTDYMESFLRDYTQIVSCYSVEGLTRQDIIPILIKGIGRKHILNLLFSMSNLVKGPNKKEFATTNLSLVPTVLQWFKTYDEVAWTCFYKRLDDSSKDRIQAWQSEGELPTVQQLKLLKNKDYIYEFDLFMWLLIARAIDYFIRDHKIGLKFIREIMHENKGDIFAYTEQAIYEHKIELTKKVPDFSHKVLLECFYYLEPIRKKCKNNNEAIKEDLKYLKTFFEKVGIDSWDYSFDFYLARWHVYNGELEKALFFYKQSFNKGLFCAGKHLEKLIHEALVIAVSVKSIDNIFIKELKWASILFKYDIPSVFDSRSSNKKRDNIEYWEVEMWQQNFETVFPKDGWFKDSKLKEVESTIQTKTLGILNPDYKNPNKKVHRTKNTEMRDGSLASYSFIKRKEPQLVYFMIFNEYKVVEKLIECGASVNVKSEVGDTPILIALRALNKTYTSIDAKNSGSRPSGDERFFRLVSNYQHKPEIINQVTQKSRYLPIIAAVETGRLDIVEKVIQLGANVNIKGTLDNVSPLYRCIQLMGVIARKPQVLHSVKEHFKSNENNAFAAARRVSGGARGHRIEDYSHQIPIEIFEQLLEMSLDEYREAFCYSELFEIAKLLIDKGARIDAFHKFNNLERYTPLMFVVENDLDDLFYYMLSKNADPKVKCKCIENGRTKYVDCWEIAENWKSEKVLSILKDL